MRTAQDSDARQWLAALGLRLAAFIAATGLVVAVLALRGGVLAGIVVVPVVLGAVAVLAATLIALRREIAAFRRAPQYRARGLGLIVGAVAATGGVAVFATGALGAELGFATLAIAVLGLSHLLAEYRGWRDDQLPRAIKFGLLGVALVLGGVFLPVTNPGTGLAVATAGLVFAYLGMVVSTEYVRDRNSAARRRRQLPATAPPESPDATAETETETEAESKPVWPVWVLVGLTLVGAGMLWFSDGQTSAGPLVLAAVALIAVAAAASDGDSDLIIFILMAALAWAALPVTAEPDTSLTPTFLDPAVTDVGDEMQPSPAMPDSESTLLVVGDSFISGEGASAYLPETNERGVNECRRADTSYPYLLSGWSRAIASADPTDDPASLTAAEREQVAEHIPARTVSVACSGAVAANLWQTPQFERQPALGPAHPAPPDGLDQLDLAEAYLASSSATVDLILVSIGGNDAGFSTVVATCFGAGDCTEIRTTLTEVLETDVRPAIRTAYREIARRAPLLTPDGEPPSIFVAAYPQPLAGTGCLPLLTGTEEQFLNEFADLLNQVIASEAASAGFHFLAETEAALRNDDLRLCDGRFWWSDVGLNFIDPSPVEGTLTEQLNPLNWVHNSVHPNEAGHEALAAAVIDFVVASPDKAVVGKGYLDAGQARLAPPLAVSAADDELQPATTDPGIWALGALRSEAQRLIGPVLLVLGGSWTLVAAALMGFDQRLASRLDRPRPARGSVWGDAGTRLRMVVDRFVASMPTIGPLIAFPAVTALVLAVVTPLPQWTAWIALAALAACAVGAIRWHRSDGQPDDESESAGSQLAALAPVIAPLQHRSEDAYERDLYYIGRLAGQFRFPALASVAIVVFLVIVVVQPGGLWVGGIGVGVGLTVLLVIVLFPMILARPRHKSAQVALTMAAGGFVFAGGLLMPPLQRMANRAAPGELAKDLPLIPGGLIALGLLFGASVVEGAVRPYRVHDGTAPPRFGSQVARWLRRIPNLRLDTLYTAQFGTGVGLVVAAAGAYFLDGLRAHLVFWMAAAGIVVHWWAVFMRQTERPWPYVSSGVLAAMVSIGLLWSGGQAILATLVVSVAALYSIARSFGPQTLRVSTVGFVIAATAFLYLLGLNAPPGTTPEGGDLLLRGLTRAWQLIVTDVLGQSDVPAPSNVLWAILALAAIVTYRWLETVNSRRTSTPVVVEGFTTPSEFVDVDVLGSQFQSELVRAGITDPPFVPAGGLGDDVISLFDAADPTGWVARAGRIFTLAFPARGTVVVPTLEVVNDNKAVVTVRVKRARNGRILYAATFEATDAREAITKAVAFVARNTLDNNATTPKWARWESTDGLGLRLYLKVRGGEAPGRRMSLERERELLHASIAASPATGLVRVELGHVYDQLGEHWRALRIHLEAAVDHPRFVPAHYRVATELAMLAGLLNTGETSVGDAPRSDRVMIDKHLRVVLERHTNLDAASYLGGEFRTSLRSTVPVNELAVAEAFLKAADDLTSTVLRLTSVPILLLNALIYGNERRQWLDAIEDSVSRRRDRGRYLVLRQGIRLRLAQLDLVRLGDGGSEAEVAAIIDRIHQTAAPIDNIVHDHEGAGTIYNAACFWSVYAGVVADLRSDERTRASDPYVLDTRKSPAVVRERAVRLLFRARAQTGEGFPDSRWLRRDPDLAPVRNEPLYLQLYGWVEKGERELADARAPDDGTDPVVVLGR